MSKASDILKQWRRHVKPQEDKNDVLKVLKFFGFEIREGGKHQIIASHPKLKKLDYNMLGLSDEFTLPLVKGRKIRKWAIDRLLKYIGLLEGQNEKE